MTDSPKTPVATTKVAVVVMENILITDTGVDTTYEIRVDPTAAGLLFGSTEVDDMLAYLRGYITGSTE